MKRIIGMFCALAAMVAGAAAEDQKKDPEFDAYVLSLLQEKGKAQAEFEAAVDVQPLLAAYSVGVFAGDKCHLTQPTKQLYEAAGGDAMINSATGKRVFAAAGVVATMTYPTGIAQANACDRMRTLLETAEKDAAK